MMHARIGKASAGLCGFIQEAMEKILRCIRAPNWIITLMLKGFDKIKRGFGDITIEIKAILKFDFNKLFQSGITDALDLDANEWKFQLRLPCDQFTMMPTCLAVAAFTGHP